MVYLGLNGPHGCVWVTYCGMPRAPAPRGISHHGRGLASGPDRNSGKVML